MSQLSQFFGGSGGGGFFIEFAESCSFLVPFDMQADVFVLGGGGSGAAAVRYVGGSYKANAASGGGAGGSVVKFRHNFKKGDVLTIIVGAGGAGQIVQSNTELPDGTNGGNSSLTGPGLSLTATGGQGGKVGYLAATAEGGLGGTGSGGDLNLTGGKGGDARSTNTSNSGANTAGGGGGVGVIGNGHAATFVTNGYGNGAVANIGPVTVDFNTFTMAGDRFLNRTPGIGGINQPFGGTSGGSNSNSAHCGAGSGGAASVSGNPSSGSGGNGSVILKVWG